MKRIETFNGLMAAISGGAREIAIYRSINCNHGFILPDGTILRGKEQENGEFPLLSFQYGDGVGLSANNSIVDLNIQAPANQKAIFFASNKEDSGTYRFSNLTLTGQFSFILRSGVKSASIAIDNMDIIASDSRQYMEQPQKYGVNALQGALTIYNFNSDKDSKIVVTGNKIRIGRKNAPVVGSGIFIAGFGDEGGKTFIEKLQTEAIYSNGKIPFGVADVISAGIFIVNGAEAREIIHDGEIVTYGVNDMVLDTWGKVGNWTCNQPIISYGPSGVGFVNFGTVNNFTANAPLETYGLGARGYNQYDGTVDKIAFKTISTYGDGSVAVQISKKIGKLTVEGDVTTFGSIGNSLVKGVNVELPAIALSIKEGGEVEEITIKGNIQTFGDNVVTYSVHGGWVKNLKIGGKIIAGGKNSKEIDVSNGGKTPMITLK